MAPDLRGEGVGPLPARRLDLLELVGVEGGELLGLGLGDDANDGLGVGSANVHPAVGKVDADAVDGLGASTPRQYVALRAQIAF